jgi:hypothetical protein
MTPASDTTTHPDLRTPHGLARQDWTSARFVEEGITIQMVYGTGPAATFLKSRLIAIDVARRVLLSPSLRRNHLLA